MEYLTDAGSCPTRSVLRIDGTPGSAGCHCVGCRGRGCRGDGDGGNHVDGNGDDGWLRRHCVAALPQINAATPAPQRPAPTSSLDRIDEQVWSPWALRAVTPVRRRSLTARSNRLLVLLGAGLTVNMVTGAGGYGGEDEDHGGDDGAEDANEPYPRRSRG